MSRRRRLRLVGLALSLGLLAQSALSQVALADPSDASIGDWVWSDRNGNGIFDPGEPGLAGVRVSLRGAGPDGLFGTGDDLTFPDQTTDSSGNYDFTGLLGGTYRVDVGESSSPPNLVTSGNDPLTVTLSQSQDYNGADFGLAFPEWITLSINPAAVTTLAGSGQDATVDGTGTAASFREMGGVAAVGGFAYVGTVGSIRKVNLTTGEVTTLAGHPTDTSSCVDSTDPAQVRFGGKIYDLTTDGYYIYSSSGDGYGCGLRRTSIATGATSTVNLTLGHHSLSFGPDGYLYAARGELVKRVDPINGTVSTFFALERGYGDSPSSAKGITSDSTDLWVTYQYKTGSSTAVRRIKRIPLDGSPASTFTETSDRMFFISSAGGYLYVGAGNFSTSSDRILRRYAKSDGSWTNVSGSYSAGHADGTGTDAWFGHIQGIVSDGSALWVADSGNRRLRKATPGIALPSSQSPFATATLGINPAAVTTLAGSGQDATVDGTGTAASFREMGGVAAVGGFAYVGTVGSIRKVNLTTGEVTTLAGHPTDTSSCVDSTDPAQVRFGGKIYDLTTDGYYIYSSSGDGYGCGLRRTSIATGATSTVNLTLGHHSLSFGPDGYLYGATGELVRQVDPINGTVSTFFALERGYRNSASYAYRITSDGRDLWVTYQYKTGTYTAVRRIKRIPLNGSASTFTETTARFVGLTSAGAYLYVAVGDPTSGYASLIRRFTKADGTPVDIAGSDSFAYADGIGSEARFNQIAGMASDGNALWVADSGNRRVRRAVAHIPTLRTEATFGAGKGAHARGLFGFQSDPVSSATGSFVNSATDISLPGIGLPFELTRSYTSADTGTGPMGVAWTHSYATSLNIQQNGDVILRAEDGQQVYFTLQGDGTFLSDPGGLSKLSSVTGGYELVRHDQLRYRFDSQGRLTELKDRNNNLIALAYGPDGRLSQATDTAGRVIGFTHDPAGLLTGVSLPDGRSVGYAYSGGRLSSVTDLRGGITSYSYDASGRLSQITDQNGHAVVRNTYGSDGRVIEQLDALGNASTFSWDAETGTSTMTDARGNPWKDIYQGNVLVRRIDPLGNTTRYGYEGALNLETVTDARGNSTTSTYDARGNLLSRAAPLPLAYRETFTYDAQNNLLSATDGRGNATTYSYDAAGNLISKTQPGSIVTSYGRDAKGLLTSLTDPRGKITLFEYDPSGNLTKVTSPLGFASTFGYDSSGRMTSRVEPRGNVQGANPDDFRWTFTYDAADNLLSESDPLGNTTAYGYDPVGNRTSRTDAKGRTTTYGYNAADELASVTAPDNTTTSYSYDSSGNLVSRTDAKDHTTAYEYDPAYRLTGLTSPTGQRWSYEYDAAGNRIKIVDAKGNATPDPADGITNFSFDEINRLVAIDYSDATPDVSFAYDPNSNRTSMTDGAGTKSYTFDALNRLTQVTRGSDSFSFEYDPSSNITRGTYPDTTVADFTYDDDGRLATVASGGVTTSYTYDPAANLLRTTLPSGNGYLEDRSYDRAGRLTEVKNVKGSETLSSFTYALDQVGNPTAVTGTEGTTTYAYDALDLLTEACFAASCPGANDPFIRYSYDPVGNRLSEARPAGTTTYSYNDSDQLLSQIGPSGSVTYSYDLNGNQTAAGSRTFSYDLANRMTSTTSGSTTHSYGYDGDGKRLTEAVGSTTTNYFWDVSFPLPQLALERDGSNNLLRRYLHGADLVSMTAPSGSFYYHYDPLGSVANLTSATGATQWSYSYEPFGTMRSEVMNDPAAPTNPMRFTGELIDTATSLYHLRARQYDPVTGRFLATDPVPLQIEDPYVAAYVYANNRPTVLVDPSGLRAREERQGVVWWAKEIWASFDYGFLKGNCIDKMQYAAGLVMLEADLGLVGYLVRAARATGMITAVAHEMLHPKTLPDAAIVATVGIRDVGVTTAMLITPGAGGIYTMTDAIGCK